MRGRGRGRGHGRGRGRGRARGGNLQTLSRGGSTQISLRDALHGTAQSNQSTQEQVGDIFVLRVVVEVKILLRMTCF